MRGVIPHINFYGAQQMPKRKRIKRVNSEVRKPICLRVKPETAKALAVLARNEEKSQGKVLDSFLKPFLKVD
jgi:hypothetical protein